MTAKEREKKELLLCKKIEEIIEVLHREGGSGLSDEQLLVSILRSFETLTDHAPATNSRRKSATLEELQKS